MIFTYTARLKSNGNKMTGTVEAPDKLSAQKQLESMGLVPISIEISQPGNVPDVHIAVPAPVVIEQTSKALKKDMLISGLMIGCGAVLSVLTFIVTQDDKQLSTGTIVSHIIAGLSFWIGLIMWFSTRVRIWWHHG